MTKPETIATIERTLQTRQAYVDGKELRFLCPIHDEQNPSARWNPEKQTWFCDVCKFGGGYLDLAQRLGVSIASPRSDSPRQFERAYDYVSVSGELLFQCVRFKTIKNGKPDKTFAQRRPDGNGGWIWDLKGVELVVYRRNQLDGRLIIFISEGEKDVDRLLAMGLPATCNPMGANKWTDAYTQQLIEAGVREVVVFPDNDDPGRKHALSVARSCTAAGLTVKVVALPDLPPKGDVSDFLDAGGTVDDLQALVESAPLWTPEAADAIDTARRKTESSILDAVEAFLGRFVAYPSEHARVAHCLWVAHTHLMEAWESTPRLAFLSPEPGSGKTRALELTETLVPRPVEAINVTSAYLFRKISDPDGLPCILHDEIDTIFGAKAKEHEEIRGVINAGHRRGASAGRCVVRGKEIFTEELPAFCAVAMAGLGNLPDTILSRSVIVKMRRRAPGEAVDPYRRRLHAPEGYQLRERLASWADQIQETLNTFPIMPDGITDRNADVWESLLSVADAVGGSWPERARVAAVALVADAMGGTPSLGIRLLSDIRTVFGDLDSLPTVDLLLALINLEESPWADLKGKPLDARRLANLLKPYAVLSKQIRLGGTNYKGYSKESLWDSWTRYLTPVDGGIGEAAMAGATRATQPTTSQADDDDFFDIGPA